MPIDPKQVQWDAPKIDPAAVKWDDAAPAKAGTGVAALDGVNAVTTGLNRAAVRLAGLPVDTVANVVDLLKILPGMAYTESTGKAPPDWLQIKDRGDTGFTGDWLLKQARKTNLGKTLVDPVNPDYEGGYLQAGGGGLTAAINPQSRAELVNRAMLGVSGSLAGKFAYDTTGSESAAVLAGLLPAAGQYAAVGAGKRLVRGGEQGRRDMQQRAQDLKNAGVDNPTLGLASGNQTIGGVENILQNTPGAVGRMRSAREAAVNGMQAKADAAARSASPRRGALEAGRDIQAGIGAFKDGFKAKQGDLYNRLDAFVPANTPSKVDSTMAVLSKLNEDIPGAPNTSRLFKNQRIQGIERALEADLNQQQSFSPSQLRAAAATNPETAAQFDSALGRGRLPYEAVKKTRTLVGNEIADNSLMSDVPRSKWNPLYGALSEDLQQIAGQAGPQATKAFNRANDYTRTGMDRLDRLRPFADKTAPEQAFTSLERTLGENVSTLQAVKKSLPEGARGTVAGTVIERLGKARAGAQNDIGDAWSSDTFLTNWNKMTPEARKELFSGFKNAEQVSADVNSVAKAASMMRDNSKMWANPSGTAANLGARAAFLGLVPGAFFSPSMAAVAGGGLLSANGLSRAVTSKGLIEAMQRENTFNPRLQGAAMGGLLGIGLQDQKKDK